MKVFLCLALVFFCDCPLRAQSINEVLAYYKNINQAELAICDSNFVSANAYYAKAFAINSKNPFHKDLSNAFGAAMDSHEYALADKYIAQLLKKGLDSESLSFVRCGYQGEALTRVDMMLTKHSNSWKNANNNPLVVKIRKMVEWDQGVRMFYIEQMHMEDYMTDSVYMVDAINAANLRNILEKNGGISENLMDETGCYIIMWHNTGASLDGKPGHLFDTLLYKAFLSFDMPAIVFANMANTNPSSAYFNYKNTSIRLPLTTVNCMYHGKAYGPCYDDTSEQRIDGERAKIGLEPLADFRRKMEVSNDGLDSNSIFHKYNLKPGSSVTGVTDEEWKLSWWLRTKGKDAKVRPAFDFNNVVPHMQIGDIDVFAINKTTYDSLQKYFLFFNREYKLGKIYASNWKDGKPPLCWDCHAEVIENPKEDLHTEPGRNTNALFVPGYRLFVIQGFDAPFRLVNIQTLFDSAGVLIKVSADVSHGFNKVITSYCGKPKSVATKRSTKYWLHNEKYAVNLASKTYTWESGCLKTIVKAEEDLNKDANKRTMSGSFLMTDTVKYNTYVQKVAERKKQLDMKYVEKK